MQVSSSYERFFANMKIVLLVCLTLAVASAYVAQDLRGLIRQCSTAADCGKERCCLNFSETNKICAPTMPKFFPCNYQDSHKCTCSEGLSCQVTQEITILGQKIQIKQCMPSDVSVPVEQIGEEAVSEVAETRVKRFLFNKCSSESDCRENFCCAFNKRCAPKLGKYYTCYLTHKHKCGCANGLVCKVTATINLPFPLTGKVLKVRQCVPADE